MNERFSRSAAVARIELAHESDFALGPIEVRPALREIACDGRRETVDRRVMQVLVALARAHGGVVPRDDLIESCWDGVVVGEDAINKCISRLRTVAEACGNVFVIETIPRVGYRLRVPQVASKGIYAAPATPQRPIYRGLQSLDEEDATIFFGRDAPIAQGLDVLRRMRAGSARSMLVILGASGAGKSSFLKAGLLARLKRDEENFLVLPVIRPERAALSGARGLAASLVCDPAGLNDTPDFARLFAGLREPIVERLRRVAESTGQTFAARPPTIVMPMDQAEELFAAENTEAARVFELLADIVRADRDIIIIATIRSDAFETLQNEPKLADVGLVPFSLARLPHGAFKDVIEGPARLADPKLAIEPALTERLLGDLATGDALPLLAFTLERLWLRHRGGGTLTLAEYTDDLGGLQGAIKSAVDAAFAQAQRDPSLPHERAELEGLARAALIPSLVQLDDADGEPRRRVEHLNALPEATLPLVRHLVDQRLLVSDRSVIDDIATDTIEVAHEAILRQWPALRFWITEERDALRALDGVRNAAREWQARLSSADNKKGDGGQEKNWLAHRGSRLQEAEALLARTGFGSGFGHTERCYLAACRKYEDEEFLREKSALARTRRLQRNIGVLIGVATALVVLAVFGIAQLLAGISATSANTLVRAAANEAEDSNYERSARLALAGLDAARWAQGHAENNKAESELRFAISISSAIAVLRGHGHQVLDATFSPDGKEIVTASRDGTARIWETRSGRTLAVLRENAAVMSARFSPDGRRVVTSSQTGMVRVWNPATGRPTMAISGHKGAVNSAVFSPDGMSVLTASADRTARIWDSASGRLIATLSGHAADIWNAEFSRDGKHVITASQDKTARIWDASTGQQIAVLRGHENPVESAVFSSDGRMAATASADGTARVWDVITGRALAVLQGHGNTVESVQFSPDGARLVTASRDGTIRIWDTNTGAEEALLKGHDGAVNSASFSSDGRWLVTASDDRTARLWDAHPRVIVLRGHNDGVNGVTFSRDGGLVATASNDRTVRIWQRSTGKQIRIFQGHENLVEAVAFSPDGTRLVSGSDDRTARVWDIRSGRILTTLHDPHGLVYGVAFSPNGQRIATASTDGCARLWNANGGALLRTFAGHEGTVNSIEFDREGRRIVTGSNDGTARVWDVATGRVLVILRGHDGAVFQAVFSPDGKEIVSAGRDGTARVWQTAGGRLLLSLRGHSDYVMSASFSADGERIITGSHDKTVRIWNARTGAEIAELRGHHDWVNSVAFDQDNQWAVSGSNDLTARIWNISAITARSHDSLIRLTCDTALGRGLSRFSTNEIRAVPVLDENLDIDVCHPPDVWARLGRIFLAAIYGSSPGTVASKVP